MFALNVDLHTKIKMVTPSFGQENKIWKLCTHQNVNN